MACTGLAFPNFEQIAFIALVAFVGTINPSTGDLGVLVPIEHAMLAHGVPDHERTRTFARYSLIGALSMAAGSLGRGAPDFLVLAGIGTVGAFKLMFYAYAALGLLSALLYRRLPHARMDAPRDQRAARAVARRGLQTGGAVQPRCLRRRLRRPVAAGAVAVRALRSVALGREPVLFLVEHAERVFLSGGGMAGETHRPHQHDGLSPTSRPASFSSWRRSRRICILALGLLLLRSALSQMDVPTRTSYVMAVVTPAERAAAASVTAVPRSLASAISPAMAGVLLTTPFTGLPLVRVRRAQDRLRRGAAVLIPAHQAAGGKAGSKALRIDIPPGRRSPPPPLLRRSAGGLQPEGRPGRRPATRPCGHG